MIDARVMFQCDLKQKEYNSWWYSPHYPDDSIDTEKTSASVMQETFDDLDLEYTGNESIDSAQLAEVIIDTWWAKSHFIISWRPCLYDIDHYFCSK